MLVTKNNTTWYMLSIPLHAFTFIQFSPSGSARDPVISNTKVEDLQDGSELVKVLGVKPELDVECKRPGRRPGLSNCYLLAEDIDSP